MQYPQIPFLKERLALRCMRPSMASHQYKCAMAQHTYQCILMSINTDLYILLNGLCVLPMTGGLCTLVAGAGRERLQAMASMLALLELIQCDGLSTKQITDMEDILARLQGVCRFSSLLCPIFGAIEAKEMQLGKPTELMTMIALYSAAGAERLLQFLFISLLCSPA